MAPCESDLTDSDARRRSPCPCRVPHLREELVQRARAMGQAWDKRHHIACCLRLPLGSFPAGSFASLPSSPSRRDATTVRGGATHHAPARFHRPLRHPPTSTATSPWVAEASCSHLLPPPPPLMVTGLRRMHTSAVEIGVGGRFLPLRRWFRAPPLPPSPCRLQCSGEIERRDM